MPRAKKNIDTKRAKPKKKRKENRQKREMQKTKSEKTTENLIKAELIKHSKKLCYCNKMVSRCLCLCAAAAASPADSPAESDAEIAKAIELNRRWPRALAKRCQTNCREIPIRQERGSEREGRGRAGCKLVFIDGEFIMQSRSGKRSKRSDSR